MTFWFAAAGLALAISALLALALVRGREAARLTAANDVAVYRDQLAEIDRDLARGVLGADEAERTRLEVSRRLLEADRKAQGARQAGSGPRAAAIALSGVIGLVLVGGSFALYTRLGAPGYDDQPIAARIAAAETARATRPDQATAEARVPVTPATDVPADFRALMERLRATVADRPDDLRGQALLAQNEARMGNYVAAYEAQRRVVELKGETATAADWADYADLLVLAAGGYVSPEAEAAVDRVLARDPENGRARYYQGLLHAQTGRPDVAFRIWRTLLDRGPRDAPWVPPIRAQIERLAAQAGVEYSLPEAPASPDAADLSAAAEMDPEQRAEMVRGMVGRLSDRLATEGGPPADWARLISALGVLGNTERARSIYAEARQVFSDAPEALEALDGAAEQAGVAQ